MAISMDETVRRWWKWKKRERARWSAVKGDEVVVYG